MGLDAQTTLSAATVTVHNPGDEFRDWCAYHRSIFDLLLVHVDRPSQLDRVAHLRNEQTVIEVGSQLTHSSRLTQTLRRQEANAGVAVNECLRRDIRWLLHLDSDELFLPYRENLWEQDSSVGQMIFINHEACAKLLVDNPFREVRHFKRNGKLPFLLYQGGKAAVRCTDGVVADGPHRFANHRGTTRVSSDGCILHYACFSFEHWLQKYLNLGLFSDWYYDDIRVPITLDFHLGSREAVYNFVETGDLEKCVRYFSRNVWDNDKLKRFVAKGSVFVVSPDELFSA